MAETSAPAVVDYLARLDDAARLLPPELRAELVGQVREHLAELEASGLGDVGLRMALERFGTPEQLVAAEAEQAGLVLHPAPPVTTSAHQPWGGLEVAAVLLVMLGGFVVPVVAPVVGMVLAWLSPRWTRRTKTGATIAFCSPVVLTGAGVLVAVAVSRWTDRTPQSDDGFWDSPYPAVDGFSAVLDGGFYALLLLSALGCLVAGLWLALAGRRPRAVAEDVADGGSR